MTRKDYQLIATPLRAALDEAKDREGFLIDSRVAVVNIAGMIASALAEDNPRFNRAKFLAACGVEE